MLIVFESRGVTVEIRTKELKKKNTDLNRLHVLVCVLGSRGLSVRSPLSQEPKPSFISLPGLESLQYTCMREG